MAKKEHNKFPKFPDAISSEEWIKYWEDKNKEKQDKKEKKLARAEKRKINLELKERKDKYEVGKYVIVKYEEYFPGAEQQIKNDYKKASAMVLYTPNTFKGPDKLNAIWLNMSSRLPRSTSKLPQLSPEELKKLLKQWQDSEDDLDYSDDDNVAYPSYILELDENVYQDSDKEPVD
ncbi:hypothetical protein EVAR_248_1 [Eumeta japonica]|uniref:Uncharacterized protein n=1 Tax=Eumeta variegata TaxID=151549 RepID=A0A4C1S9B4_EUMVA|nr:hypothetical protein EVAR_248_1 [Eumeta japonica]